MEVKRISSFDSADHIGIMAAGESSQTDGAAFTEEQKQMLHEYKSSILSLPRKRDVRMSNEERTDSAGNMNFNGDHCKIIPSTDVLKNPPSILLQPGLLYEQENVNAFLPFSLMNTRFAIDRPTVGREEKGKYCFAFFVFDPAPTIRRKGSRTKPNREHFDLIFTVKLCTNRSGASLARKTNK